MAEQEYNPETGQVERMAGSTNGTASVDAATAGAPLGGRSWSKSERLPGRWNARFNYEGATVYLNTPAKESPEWQALMAQEKALQERGRQLQEMNRRLKEAGEDEAGKPVDTAALQGELLQASEGMTASLEEFQLEVIRTCVVGWTKGPIPYSREAVEDLPREMVAEWSQVILEKSRLGSSDAHFLARN